MHSGVGGHAGVVAEALQAGVEAPEFALNSTPDQKVRLSDFRGRTLIMAFYPADWSPVCPDQIALYNEILPAFNALGADLSCALFVVDGEGVIR